jgi:hypothetical protein
MTQNTTQKPKPPPSPPLPDKEREDGIKNK